MLRISTLDPTFHQYLAILLPRSRHPVRDSYLLIARLEGCWQLELGVVKHGTTLQYVKVS